jgi:hypothetical protein
VGVSWVDAKGHAHRDRLERLIYGRDVAGGATREAPAQAELRPTCAAASRFDIVAPNWADACPRTWRWSAMRITLMQKKN